MDRTKGTLVLVLLLSLVCRPALAADAKPLIFGVHPYLPATELFRIFSPLADYLSHQIKQPVELQISRNYQEHIDEIGRNAIDFSFIGPAPYIKMSDMYGKKVLLARLVLLGSPSYRGLIITRNDSPIRKLTDLSGKSFAFGDRDSTMSHLVPRYMLIEAGITMEKLTKVVFLNNHNDVALGVLSGEFDAGALKSEIFGKYQERGLRVIMETPPMTTPVFLARNGLNADIVQSTKQALFNMSKDPQSLDILRNIQPDITGLASATDDEYDSLRVVLKTLAKIGIHP